MFGNEQVAKKLGYSGLIPFIVFTIGSWVQLPIVSNSPYILVTYAAVILSFMGAIHWGIAMSSPKQGNSQYFIVSVIPALIAWVSLLMSEDYAIILLIIGFIALIMYDRAVEKLVKFPSWYLPMRKRLTTVVILCLSMTQLSFLIL
ncbi:DUF3429 domain-containing protein [Candidatus Thioglobus sp.]|nr:DUF3429 domain-containing protein [Candidatus Thioglobus sp.]MDC0388597.1 DUF3429 domain-containing protein [Candidatus Thioglobus sp.]MDC0904004.1 DUF3429 domain-containing protein [Candidatus Thioglobus sp.]MDC3265840.1 DUF3429 domain-containing protein [Candidatus Thioglobus sp.]